MLLYAVICFVVFILLAVHFIYVSINEKTQNTDHSTIKKKTNKKIYFVVSEVLLYNEKHCIYI